MPSPSPLQHGEGGESCVLLYVAKMPRTTANNNKKVLEKKHLVTLKLHVLTAYIPKAIVVLCANDLILW